MYRQHKGSSNVTCCAPGFLTPPLSKISCTIKNHVGHQGCSLEGLAKYHGFEKALPTKDGPLVLPDPVTVQKALTCGSNIWPGA